MNFIFALSGESSVSRHEYFRPLLLPLCLFVQNRTAQHHLLDTPELARTTPGVSRLEACMKALINKE